MSSRAPSPSRPSKSVVSATSLEALTRAAARSPGQECGEAGQAERVRSFSGINRAGGRAATRSGPPSRRRGQRRDSAAMDIAAAPTATATAPTATLFAMVAVVATPPRITHGVMMVQIPTTGATQAMPWVRP